MDSEEKTLRLLKRLVFLLPLLALPFAPAMGRTGAELLLYATLPPAAAQ